MFEFKKKEVFPSMEENTLDLSYRNLITAITDYDRVFPAEAAEALIPKVSLIEFEEAPRESLEAQIAYLRKLSAEVATARARKSYALQSEEKLVLTTLHNVLSSLLTYAEKDGKAFMKSKKRKEAMGYITGLARTDALSRRARSANALKEAFKPRER